MKKIVFTECELATKVKETFPDGVVAREIPS
jgi:hypothetical protein